MEQLEYLIRSLTYKRSCFEIELREANKYEGIIEVKYDLAGKIEGLSIAITEIYNLISEQAFNITD